MQLRSIPTFLSLIHLLQLQLCGVVDGKGDLRKRRNCEFREQAERSEACERNELCELYEEMNVAKFPNMRKSNVANEVSVMRFSNKVSVVRFSNWVKIVEINSLIIIHNLVKLDG